MKLLGIFLTVVCWVGVMLADTNVCGNVSGTWDSTGSPYYVNCDVTVPSGQTLNIQAGVHVLFSGPYEFNVYGDLQAVGTEHDSILFSGDTTSLTSRWQGLRFNAANNNSQATYCLIENTYWPNANNDFGGGGINILYCNPSILHCTIRNNRSFGNGGGIGGAMTNSLISDCYILNNYAPYGGGGNFGEGSPIFVRCVFEHNSAGQGGGMGFWDTNASLINCTFIENHGDDAGGIRCANATITVRNSIFTGNTSHAAISLWGGGSSATINNCCFWQNTNRFSGNGNFPPSIGNIVQVNSNTDSCDQYYNVFLNPLFVNPTTGDFHLQLNSPCIDTGDPNSPHDPDGTRADMGAFPFLHSPPCPPTSLPFTDNFDSPTLDSCWTWTNEDTSHWSLTERLGWMRIQTQITPGFMELKRSVADTSFSIETKINFVPGSSTFAGLIVRFNNDNWIDINRQTIGTLRSHSWTNGQPEYYSLSVNWDPTYLKISKENQIYAMSASPDGTNWTTVATWDRQLAVNGNCIVGIQAGDYGGADFRNADFDYFRIEPVREIQVTSPNGGEQWTLFTTDTVRWTSTGIVGNVNIELNTNYPSGGWTMIASDTPNDGSEPVFVDFPLSNLCRVRITAIEENVSDESNNNFTIGSSQGFLALVRVAQPTLQVTNWNAGTVECPNVVSETFRCKNFGTNTIRVFRAQEPVTDEFSRITNCPTFYDLTAGQMGGCDVTLNFTPESDGTFGDTLRIQTNASNGVGGYVSIPLVGMQITTPASPQIIITREGINARLRWNPIALSTGGCPITPTAYLVYYSTLDDNSYDFHGFTTDTSYVHSGVFQFAPSMFYRVTTFTGVLGLIEDLPQDGSLTEIEVEESIKLQTENFK